MARQIETCATCRFFVDNTCRRHAPQLVVVQTRDSVTRLTEWPPTSPDLSCGDRLPFRTDP